MKRLAIKTTIPIIVTLLLVMQVFSPMQATAARLNYDNPNSGNSPYKLKTSDIVNSQTFMSVLACTGIVNKVAGAITNLLSDLLLSKAERIAKDQALEASKKSAVTAAVAASSLAAGTGDPAIAEGVISNYPQFAPTPTQDDQAQQDAKTLNCLNGIAIQLARNQLTAMTRATMTWITTGFSGNPFYVRNIDSYMNSITNNILDKELSIFKDPVSDQYYPYGKDFAKNAARQYGTYGSYGSTGSIGKYQQNLTNNLSDGSTPASYASDFGEGGWDAWLSLTQRPQNNPLGFTLVASESIANKQATAVANTQTEINQNNGYISQKKCVEWWDVDENGNPKIDSDGSIATTTTPPTVNPKSGEDSCAQYETITPGSTIRDKVAKYINSPETQLELVNTMNDALNNLFSSLLGQLIGQGLTGLSTDTSLTGNSGGFGLNTVRDLSGNEIKPQKDTSGGFSGSFDLTKDIPGIIAIQQKYAGYTDTTGKKVRGVAQIALDDVLPKVLPALGKLDYCIPGPNLNWQTNSSDTVNNLSDYFDMVRTQKLTFPFIGDVDLLVLPDPSTYKSSFDGSNLWEKVKAIFTPAPTSTPSGSGFISQIAAANLALLSPVPLFTDNDTPLGPYKSSGGFNISVDNSTTSNSTTSSSDNVLQAIKGKGAIKTSPDVIDNEIKGWTNYIKNFKTEYIAKINALYGPNSPMQSGIDANGNISTDYLPMAQAGLSLTKDLKTTADTITAEQSDYKNSITEANANIYRLKQIEKQVDAIVQVAQKRRADNRAKLGEDPLTQACINAEVINITGNNCIDPATGNTIECVPSTKTP